MERALLFFALSDMAFRVELINLVGVKPKVGGKACVRFT